MNNLLSLKGHFESRSSNWRGGPRNLRVNDIVYADHLEQLATDLEDILLNQWQGERWFDKVLVSLQYQRIIPKSRRVFRLLADQGLEASETICGARFGISEDNRRYHIMTHYVSTDFIQRSINELRAGSQLIHRKFDGQINQEELEHINKHIDDSEYIDIGKTAFRDVVVDACEVSRFFLDQETESIGETILLNVYETERTNSTKETIKLLNELGLDIRDFQFLNATTFRVTPEELARLKYKVPYLIAMETADLTDLELEDFLEDDLEDYQLTIPEAQDEPVIGVIDTYFDQRVYFADWVEHINLLDEGVEITANDTHGTAVTSLIVDGPRINPQLEDGCGRFRVRHFTVATSGKVSSFEVTNMIQRLVEEHPDIKVWNLSLGAVQEINANFISPEGSVLDQLQHECDVLFVVAGTNDNSQTLSQKIGAPADSINSLVVNATDSKGQRAAYARKGPVLSFYTKPDIASFGGDSSQWIRVCTANGEAFIAGTSFAAPWISRKAAFLIHKMGFGREVVKALIIHSATPWEKDDADNRLLGYGEVPRHIKDVVNVPSDEIRFVIQGTIDNYRTYNYNLPIPSNGDKCPYIAKATLCYFPKGNRNQGVDYTRTELDFKIGRINDKGRILSVDNNRQNLDHVTNYLHEEDARKSYRKWDNVKHIVEYSSHRKREKKQYGQGLWGIDIRCTERGSEQEGRGINFGLVVGLKELKGVNRIEDFIQLCSLRGWLVEAISIEEQVDIYESAQEEIEWE